MGFHWRIFLLSRANRLYSIFLHWLEEPGVPRVSDILLSSTWNTGFGPSARYEPCQTTDFFTFYFRWREEGATSVLGSQPIIWLLSPSPFRFQMTRVRLLSTNTCWYPLCDLHSFLTVTFLMGCHCSFQWEDSINLISIVSVGYHVTLSLQQTWINYLKIKSKVVLTSYFNIYSSSSFCESSTEQKSFLITSWLY